MTTTMIGRRRPAAFRWAGQALAWIVILVATAAVAAGVLLPRVAGATPYTILTGSMEPNYPPGTLVVAKPTAVDEIGVGTVITYQLKSGEPTVVTHRVVAVEHAGDGELSFRTQGDANDSADRELVRPVQIKGTVWYAVPKLGWMSTALGHQERNAAVLVVAGGLALYAAAMLGSSLRDRIRDGRRRKTEIAAGRRRFDQESDAA